MSERPLSALGRHELIEEIERLRSELEREQLLTAPNPPAVPDSSRPGWVAVDVLLALADELHAHGSKCDASKTQRAKALWDAERRVREIAGGAGDAEAVERAACKVVQRMIEDRCVVSVSRALIDGELCSCDHAEYVVDVHVDNGEIVDSEMHRDLYEAITQAPSFKSDELAGKGGEGE